MTAPHLPPSITPETAGARTTKSERVERGALVLIVVVVGALAGRASFSHVVDWSMRNLPDGTHSSDGYTNAMVSELLPVGALLFIRFQRRHGRKPGRLAWSMLIGAGLFSMTAQLAEAMPSPSGWLVASVPTLAFMALTKLLLSMKPAAVDDPAPARAVRVQPRPAAIVPARPPAVTAHTAPAIPKKEPSADPPPVRKRVAAKSLTAAAKVTHAVAELGDGVSATQIAARAGVSESTARRHMPKNLASPSGVPPAQTRSVAPSERELTVSAA